MLHTSCGAGVRALAHFANREILRLCAFICTGISMISCCVYSTASLALASAFVCHCILRGASSPPRFNGTTWAMTYPGQLPEVLPVDGQGWLRSNSCLASGLRLMRPRESRAQLAQ